MSARISASLPFPVLSLAVGLGILLSNHCEAADPLLIDQPDKVTKESLAGFYRGFAKLTPEPRFLPARESAPCAPLGDPQTSNPHLDGFIHIYASTVASKAVKAGAKVFPEGSILVKEKMSKEKAVTEVGGMVKREKGFDPKNGDWEYFFLSADGKYTKGKALANCAQCHNMANKDGVWVAWTLTQTAQKR